MNKFDDMMCWLSAHNSDFAQVVAIDAAFDVFTRAWCVSELAQAHTMGMRQHLKLMNIRSLQENEEQLRKIRIENMQASRPQDVEEILARIPDKMLFNEKLQKLLFESLLPRWYDLDGREQFAVIGNVARWQTVINRRGSVGVTSYRQDS